MVHLDANKFVWPFAALVLYASASFAADPIGNWRVKDGTALIRIAPCGGSFCGTISWTSSPGLDEHNPDPSKRDRPIVGTQILLRMQAAGADRWDGKIYNPENGKTYTGHITLVDPNTLRVQGCLLLFCGGEDWTRSH
jgi:uncharacterized protein (DUF2147 family)